MGKQRGDDLLDVVDGVGVLLVAAGVNVEHAVVHEPQFVSDHVWVCIVEVDAAVSTHPCVHGELGLAGVTGGVLPCTEVLDEVLGRRLLVGDNLRAVGAWAHEAIPVLITLDEVHQFGVGEYGVNMDES